MEFTGERFTPDNELDSQLVYEHYHRYEYIKEIVAGKSVLDIACGEGYGSSLLSSNAASVVGVDIDPESINFAREKYSNKDNLEFLLGSVTDIPLADKSIDVVVSFETIEHISEHDMMLNQLSRVLKDDGVLVISTPDKKVYTDESGEVNRFHVKELYRNEFKELLNNFFENVMILGQRFITISTILPEGDLGHEYSISGDIIEEHSKYIVAICSNSSLDKLKTPKGIYFEPENDIFKKNSELLKWASSVHDDLMRSQKDYFSLKDDWKKKSDWIDVLKAEIEDLHEAYSALQKEFLEYKSSKS